MNSVSASGLDGVVVANTVLSEVDGERGRLVIRGYTVEDLVGRATFEDVCGLIWNGAWTSLRERDALRAMSDAKRQAFTLLSSLGEAKRESCGQPLADGGSARRAAS